ncbi:uncharacterized protein [Ptychodera flava]|uniref:uncharacterized protein n=1 Tax=Ptychodera flava TaxID=63121 RepID=UPI00396A9854
MRIGCIIKFAKVWRGVHVYACGGHGSDSEAIWAISPYRLHEKTEESSKKRRQDKHFGQIDRWKKIKSDKGLAHHVDVARYLIDCELLELENSDNLERQEVEENSDSLERQEVDTVEDTDEEGSQTSLPRISTDEDIVNLLDGEFCLTFVNQLLELARERPSSQCKVGSCKSTPQIRTFYRGSALYLKWVCEEGHLSYCWCSQPILNRRMHSGDILTASAILMSGNNFGKVKLLAKMLNLRVLSADVFYRIQRHYLVPCIDGYWLQHQQEFLSKYEGKDVILLGDGRMDSPGYSAQYCSYTFMENSTKDILSLTTLDKRFTEKKSTNLEKACFKQGIEELQDKGLQISEVVTDAHPQIGAEMSE